MIVWGGLKYVVYKIKVSTDGYRFLCSFHGGVAGLKRQWRKPSGKSGEQHNVSTSSNSWPASIVKRQ
jgi:hypothetical protein